MFSNYEIKQENKEEILYLYLDFNQEFAKLHGKKNAKRITLLVKEFLHNNKIKFNGQKIAIVMSGIIIANLLITKPILNNKEVVLNDNTNYVITLIDKEKIEPQIKEETIIKEEIKKEEINQLTKKEESKKSTNQNQQTNKKQVTTNKKIIKESSTKENKNKVENNEPKQEVVDNNIYVTIKRANGNIEKIELEEYVIGVVAAEMPASFENNALKAQAIIARTYALKAMKTQKELTDNSSTQNYKSIDAMKVTWKNNYNTYYNKIKNAVNATKGLYLTYNGEIIEAMYHSTSNGKTENAQYVWSNSFPYLISVESPYDNTNKSFINKKKFSYDELSKKLGFIVNNETNYEILSKTDGDRILDIVINNEHFTGVTLRNLLGLRSADFTITKDDDGLTFTTKGFGHGVGLSQYGANGMAKNGYNYMDIIYHYYPGVTIKKIT